jgi:hypothetical protein
MVGTEKNKRDAKRTAAINEAQCLVNLKKDVSQPKNSTATPRKQAMFFKLLKMKSTAVQIINIII